MRAWPTPSACAAAPRADVVRAWAGLGYDRRALSLHRCAEAIVAEHDGHVPDDLARLVELPGVGPYTARAVLAFAFGRDVAVVDTNVARVLLRSQVGKPMPLRDVQALADALVPPGDGWSWNQALLDLGATVCTARRPRCDECVWAGTCAWRRTGGTDPWIAVRQSRFEGSDRQGRGRLLAALRIGPVEISDLARVCGWPDDPRRARQVAEGVVRDGFADACGSQLQLA
jgi:A/G-specific adenine glycosylase